MSAAPHRRVPETPTGSLPEPVEREGEREGEREREKEREREREGGGGLSILSRALSFTRYPFTPPVRRGARGARVPGRGGRGVLRAVRM